MKKQALFIILLISINIILFTACSTPDAEESEYNNLDKEVIENLTTSNEKVESEDNGVKNDNSEVSENISINNNNIDDDTSNNEKINNTTKNIEDDLNSIIGILKEEEINLDE